MKAAAAGALVAAVGMVWGWESVSLSGPQGQTGSAVRAGAGAARGGAGGAAKAGLRGGARAQTGSAAGGGGSGQSGPRAGQDQGAEWVTVPAGWRMLAELAVESRAAGVRVESRRIYGDPAGGCFALLQRATAPAKGFNERHAQAELLAGLQAAGFKGGPNSGDMPFSGRGVQGRLRATATPVGEDRIAVLSAACFYNDREPERCRPMCDAMLDSAGAVR